MFNIYYIIIIVLIAGLIGLVVYFMSKSLKKADYDNENKHAILEEMRKSFESQMYSINNRLIQNEERWKDVNHLLIRNESSLKTAIAENKRVVLSDFLRANGISENDLLIDARLIFVLTPFHDEFSKQYSVIKDVCQTAGFSCVRGDEEYFKSDIFPEILKYIIRSRFIIANIDGRNANVFYELGIAQSLDKPVLLVSAQPGDLPVDVKSKRLLVYKSLTDLSELLRIELMDIRIK
jgi:hypothetical protein